jgi:IS30 family transposase
VDSLIREDYSPEQASNFLRIKVLLFLCHETLYQYIYKDKRCGGSLYMHLRLRCRKKRKRYRSKDSRGVLRGNTMIEERPQDINDRRTEGHWEIDAVMVKRGKDCIASLGSTYPKELL